jgi:hypothetical protein
MMDGAPHFHLWLVPRSEDAPLRGVAYLADEHACTEAEAIGAATILRVALNTPANLPHP